MRTRSLLRFCLDLGHDGNNATVVYAAILTAVEGNHTVYKSEEGMILTNTYICAGVVSRTALTHDNVAGLAYLTTPNLNA